MTGKPRPASATEIVAIVGPLDDALLVEILTTGASAAEVLEAYTWASADDQIGTELERGPHGAVAQVYEILKREEPDTSEATERR